jgi:hypothetical protein
MEKKKIVIDKPVSIAGLTIIMVNQMSVHIGSTPVGIAVMAIKQPLAMVTASPQKRAFRITGKEISLDELVGQYPALKEYL